MKRIFKWVLSPEGTTIGEGCHVKPLSVGWQDDALVLWGEFEERTPAHRVAFPDDPPRGIRVVVVPTGGATPPGRFKYLGTAQDGPASMFAPAMVMHVYWTYL
jgi:hypothetical protein